MTDGQDDQPLGQLQYAARGGRAQNGKGKSFKLDVDHRRNLNSLILLMAIAGGGLVFLILVVVWVSG